MGGWGVGVGGGAGVLVLARPMHHKIRSRMKGPKVAACPRESSAVWPETYCSSTGNGILPEELSGTLPLH